MLTPRKIKEITHFLRNPNHINKISYMLSEIWLPNLWSFLVTYLFPTSRFYLMKLTQTHHFCVRKTLQSIQILQLYLKKKFRHMYFPMNFNKLF